MLLHILALVSPPPRVSKCTKLSNSKSFRECNLPSIVIGTGICNLLPSKVYLSLGSPRQTKQGHKRERVCARVLWADGSHAVLWESPLSTPFTRPYKTDSLLKYLTQEKRKKQRREEARTTVKINKTALGDWCVKAMADILVTINKCGCGHKGRD